MGTCLVLSTTSGLAQDAAVVTPASSTPDGPYEANWASLEKHNPAPDWFRDAKFGIYFHWGVYSVPAFGNEWYPHRMHKPGDRCNKYHIKNYGDPTEVGYESFVKDFKAENFDADRWCALFKKAGARFVGPVSEHHDGYSMWDSEMTPWNSMDTGPHRDITGEMAMAARKYDMKFVTTFHHARNSLWKKEDGEWTGHYMHAKKNYPEAFDDPQRAIMYGLMPRDKFLEMWLGKLKEVIDNYHPDLIWFDSWLHEIPEQEMTEFVAHYLNDARKQDKEVVITYKQKDMPQSVGVLDIEKGGLKDVTEFCWLSDDTISLGSWCYTNKLRIKPTKVVLHSLIDIVSKNGQLILNVSPKADGTIPENQQKVLIELGQWLERYGECIYGTRPFKTYGHGPTKAGKGHFGGQATNIAYTSQDVRYTTKGNVVYALILGPPPKDSQTRLTATAGVATQDNIKSISMLGSDAKISFEVTPEGIVVNNPAESPDLMTNVYKIEMTGN